MSLVELMCEPANFTLEPLVMCQDILELKLGGLVVVLNGLGFAAGSLVLVPNGNLFGWETKLGGQLLLALSFKLGIGDEACL